MKQDDGSPFEDVETSLKIQDGGLKGGNFSVGRLD